MATEVTFKALGHGRLPRIRAFASAPSPALRVCFGRFVTGTSEYPDDGYVAADLESLTGFTKIVSILPCGFATNGTHEKGWPVGWDSSTRTLRVYGIPTITGAQQVGGTVAGISELATNAAGADAATFDAVILGY